MKRSFETWFRPLFGIVLVALMVPGCFKPLDLSDIDSDTNSSSDSNSDSNSASDSDTTVATDTTDSDTTVATDTTDSDTTIATDTTDSDTTVGTDTNDTDTTPVVVNIRNTGVVMASGGGTVASTNYKMTIFVGGVSPVGTTQDANNKLSLGVGQLVSQ